MNSNAFGDFRHSNFEFVSNFDIRDSNFRFASSRSGYAAWLTPPAMFVVTGGQAGPLAQMKADEGTERPLLSTVISSYSMVVQTGTARRRATHPQGVDGTELTRGSRRA